MTINSTTRKTNVLVGNGNTATYPFAFKVFTDADVVVKKLEAATSIETTLALGVSNDYIVTLSADQNSNPGGSITLKSGGNDQNLASGFSIVITSAVQSLQGTDLTNQGGFFPEVINDALDKSTVLHQQQQDELDRSIKFSLTNTIGSLEINENAAARKNRVLGFDNTGEFEVLKELGTYRGNWAASTSYAVRDFVKDTSTNNIFFCNTAHTSSGAQPLTTNTHSANWDLIVDAATATTSSTNAASSATAAASSATSAASSATTATTQASTATTQASTATTKASEATTAKTAAETAQAAAETAKTAAEAALDSFDDRYLGTKSSDPTLDNDGNALIDGALYFNTNDNVTKVYDLGNTVWRLLTPTDANQTKINTVQASIGNVNTVAGSISNVNTVAGDISNVNAVVGNATNINNVAADATDIGAVAGKATEIGRLGTSDAVADLAILGTTDAVADMNTLGTTSNVSNMNTLAAISSNITTTAGNSTNINTVAANNSNISTVAGISSNVTTVAGISSNVTTVANDGSDIGTVAGAIANVNNVGNSIANVNTTAASIANVNTTAAAIANVNTVAGISSNVTTVAGDTTAINNITTNLSAVQGAATNATNAASSATASASSATAAASSQTAAASSATAAASSQTAAASSQTAAASSQTAAATSATSAASSASASTTQANNSAASATTANAHQLLAKQYRDTASGILTQSNSTPYNLSDSVSSHTNWGSITDVGNADFADESSNAVLTMTEGSATYNYGAIA